MKKTLKQSSKFIGERSPIFQKLGKKSGFQMIEYTFVMLLLLSSFILTRTFAVRAMHANAKSWNDSVTSSLIDSLPDCPECTSFLCLRPTRI